MICHAIRDLGLVSVSHTIDIDVSWRIGQQVYLGVKGFYHPSTNYFAPIPEPVGRTPEIPGYGGMFTITFGAAPGSVQVRDPFPDSRGAVDNPYSSMLSSGRADFSRAEDDTADFIQKVHTDVEAVNADGKLPPGTQLWQMFLQFN
jgi:hypothetical protein